MMREVPVQAFIIWEKYGIFYLLERNCTKIKVFVQRRERLKHGEEGGLALPVTVCTHYRCCGASPESFSGFSILECERTAMHTLPETSRLGNANSHLIYEIVSDAS